MPEALLESESDRRRRRNADAKGKGSEDQGLGHEAKPSSAADKGVVTSRVRVGFEMVKKPARNTRDRATEMGGVRAGRCQAPRAKRREGRREKTRDALHAAVLSRRPGQGSTSKEKDERNVKETVARYQCDARAKVGRD